MPMVKLINVVNNIKKDFMSVIKNFILIIDSLSFSSLQNKKIELLRMTLVLIILRLIHHCI